MSAPRRRYRLAEAPVVAFPGSDRHVVDQAAAYALGALEPDEVDAVEWHIAACPRCARAVQAARQTTAMLPFVAPPAVPPPDVKVALFARIAQSQARASAPREDPARWAAPASAGRTPTIPAAGPWLVDGPPRPTAAPPRPTPRRARRFAGIGPVVSTAIPLVLVIGLLGAWSLNLRDTGRDKDAAIETYQERIDTLVGSSGAPELPGNYRGSVAVERVTISDRSGDGNTALATVQGLENPDPAATYRLWAIRTDGSVGPGGDLQVTGTGTGAVSLELDEPWANLLAVCVTRQGEDPNVACATSPEAAAP
jgi:hypothetical protein